MCVAQTSDVLSNLRYLRIIFVFCRLLLESFVVQEEISSLLHINLFPNQFTTGASIHLNFASCTRVQAAPKKDLKQQSIQLCGALKIRLRSFEFHQITGSVLSTSFFDSLLLTALSCVLWFFLQRLFRDRGCDVFRRTRAWNSFFVKKKGTS
jgi:hypothetical protein